MVKMEKVWAYYSNKNIDDLIYKVISVRSLPIEHFTKQLQMLIEASQNEAYDRGRADYIENMSYYD